MDSQEVKRQVCFSRKVKKFSGIVKHRIYLIRLETVLEEAESIKLKFVKVLGYKV
jgi:hypothetical protein